MGFVISRFFSIHFTTTGVKKSVRFSEDFVKWSFVNSRFHCTFLWIVTALLKKGIRWSHVTKFEFYFPRQSLNKLFKLRAYLRAQLSLASASCLVLVLTHPASFLSESMICKNIYFSIWWRSCLTTVWKPSLPSNWNFQEFVCLIFPLQQSSLRKKLSLIRFL